MKTALIQTKASMNHVETLDRPELRDASVNGAQVSCLAECFSTWFFRQRINPEDQLLAEPIDGPTITRMRKVAIVVPFYERVMAGELYNSAAVVDEKGKILGLYHEHHIPMSVSIDPIGQVMAQASDSEEEMLVADLNLARIGEVRKAWPFYRDRRSDAYQAIFDA